MSQENKIKESNGDIQMELNNIGNYFTAKGLILIW